MTDPRIEVCLFPGNKKTALTLSFVDGVVTGRAVIEKFNQWGLKGTWNLNSGAFGGHHIAGDCAFVQASEVAALYAGHEVAIHTVHHPHLTRLEPAHIAQEVLDDKIALEDLVAYPVRGMAYPFGVYNDQVIATLRGLGITYCRTVEEAEPCFPPKEPSPGPPPATSSTKRWRRNGKTSTKTNTAAASFSSGATPTNSRWRMTGPRWNASSNPSPACRTCGTAPTSNSSITNPPAAASSSPPTANTP